MMRVIGLTSAALLGTLVLTQPSVAQTVAAADAPDEAQARESSEGIEDIVVTAQRREESLQRAAIAVTAVSGRDLITAGVSDVANLTKLVPALVVQPAGGSLTNFYLRGIGTLGSNAYAENAVAFNFGGVYIARPTAPIGSFYDLQRIEVVKGPQGTLYGRNATGGAVNVLPAKPELGQVGGSAILEYGNYNTRKGSAVLNLPLGKAVAIRAAAQVVDRDGYLSDGYDDEQGEAARLSLLYKPNDAFSLLLVADYFHQGGMGVGPVLIPGSLVPTASPLEDRVSGADPRSHAELRLRFPFFINSGLVRPPQRDGYQDSSFYGVSAVVEADLGFATLTAIPAHRVSKPDFRTYNFGFLGENRETDTQNTLEVRLSSNGNPALRYVIGGYYFREHQQAYNQYSQGGAQTTTFLPDLKTESKALFGQLTFDVSESLRLVGGLRYTAEEKSQHTPVRQFSAAKPDVPFSLASGELSFNKLTWKAGLEYDVGPRSLIYANVSTGFKAGGFFVAIRNSTFDPETLTAFTIGSKNRFLDNRLQLNLEAFYWDYKDQQISFLGPVETSLGVFGSGLQTVNAGNARIAGIEVEALFMPTDADRFSGTVQFLDTQYTDFHYVAISLTGVPPRSGCQLSNDTSLAVTAPARLFLVDCSGRPALNSPRWSINLGYERTFGLAGDFELLAGARTRIETSRYLALEFLPEERQGGYMTSDAYLTLNAPDERWSLTAYINNIEDQAVLGNAIARPILNVVYGTLRPPRTYGLRAAVKF
jgi:iron complex outermembrane receptor protein